MTNDLDEMLGRLRAFARERDWEQFHDPKNLAMCLASEAGELLSELRWVSGSEADEYCRAAGARERVMAELGDIGIGWLMLCDRIGLDPIEAVRLKLEWNAVKYPAGPSRGRAEPPDK